MLEQNWRIQVVLIKPFIVEEDRHEVAQSDYGHLILVYLSFLDLNEPILRIFLHFELAFSFKHVRDHPPIIRFQQLEQISVVEKEILVQRNGHLELFIVDRFRYQPAVMDK